MSHHADGTHPGDDALQRRVGDLQEPGAGAEVTPMQQARFCLDRRDDSGRRVLQVSAGRRSGTDCSDVSRTSRSCSRPSDSCAAFKVRSGRTRRASPVSAVISEHIPQFLDGDADFVQGLGVVSGHRYARWCRADVRCTADESLRQALAPGLVGGSRTGRCKPLQVAVEVASGSGSESLAQGAHGCAALPLQHSPARPAGDARRPAPRVEVRRSSPAPRRVREPARGHG